MDAFDKPFIDIGLPDDYLKAKKFLKETINDELPTETLKQI